MSFPEITAQLLKKLGVDTVFGIVGIPIVELGDEFIKQGINFISFRNEQAASYAASAYGYLTGKPGFLLVVGGPGVIHATAGIYNSTANRWPLVVLAGSSEDVHKGGFQELDQVSYLSPHVKFAARVHSATDMPFLLEKAYRSALHGVPGVSYIDIPGNLVTDPVTGHVDMTRVTHRPAPRAVPEFAQLENAVQLLKSAKNPLVVVGKGAAHSVDSVRNFIRKHNIPFLPTPMAKGIVPDSWTLNTASARSLALKNADVVLLLGARLNWILHYGEAPRFKQDVKFIQVDISAEEIGNNASSEFGLLGDIGLTVDELSCRLGDFRSIGVSSEMATKIAENEGKLVAKEKFTGGYLTYNVVYKIMREMFDHSKTILVIEGANTMDIARISFPVDVPRHKLDAGTNATMGVGLGYAIAAKAAHPDKDVIAIEGDSAFGFSGMEIETAVRSKLPMILVIMNNSGLYHGVPDDFKGLLPSTALSKHTRYDIMAQSLGAEGALVKTPDQLTHAMTFALKNLQQGKATLLNVIIGPGTQKKVGFGWQNKPKV